jgi:arginine deiminase
MKLPASHAISRRHLLTGAGGIAVAMAAPRASSALVRPFVTSESTRLRRVLINPATAADYHGCAAMSAADPFWRDAVDDIVAQHAALALQLQSPGAQVMYLQAVLENAIDAARRQGAWAAWLRGTYPELADSHEVRAMTLLARDASGRCAIAASGQSAMHGLGYVRDFAVMLPGGLLLGNVADASRSRQQALFRFMVAFAPEFRDYPIVLDGAAAGLRAEGGDIQVLDRHTLLVGVGNHTDARVAPLLARKTGMDVIAVHIRNADPARWRLDHDPLRDFFLHLNTSVAQVAPGHMLALPWLFEAEHTGRAALQRPDPLVADFGQVTEYRAWSGDRVANAAGLKLVDCLRERGVTLSFVDGTDRDQLDRWLAETARTRVIFPARERQATNLLATAPGRLVAFCGAERTHAALRATGVQVRTAAGGELWRGYGGPHCLTLPLERA